MKARKKTAFKARFHIHEESISYEEFGQKIREVEQFLLAHPDKMKEQIEGYSEKEAVGNVIKLFSICLYASVRYGSVEAWLEQDIPFAISERDLAIKSAEVLFYPDFEFSSEWPWTKQEMQEVCRKAYEERENIRAPE